MLVISGNDVIMVKVASGPAAAQSQQNTFTQWQVEMWRVEEDFERKQCICLSCLFLWCWCESYSTEILNKNGLKKKGFLVTYMSSQSSCSFFGSQKTSFCWVFSHSSLAAAPSQNWRKLKMSYWSESQPNISSSPPQLPKHLIPKQAAIRLTTKWAKFPIKSNRRVLSFCSANVARGGCSPCCLTNRRCGLSGSLSWSVYWLHVTAFEEWQIEADF